MKISKKINFWITFLVVTVTVYTHKAWKPYLELKIATNELVEVIPGLTIDFDRMYNDKATREYIIPNVEIGYEKDEFNNYFKIKQLSFFLSELDRDSSFKLKVLLKDFEFNAFYVSTDEFTPYFLLTDNEFISSTLEINITSNRGVNTIDFNSLLDIEGYGKFQLKMNVYELQPIIEDFLIDYDEDKLMNRITNISVDNIAVKFESNGLRKLVKKHFDLFYGQDNNFDSFVEEFKSEYKGRKDLSNTSLDWLRESQDDFVRAIKQNKEIEINVTSDHEYDFIELMAILNGLESVGYYTIFSFLNMEDKGLVPNLKVK